MGSLPLVPPQSVQSLSHVFVTPWTAAHQASLSITNSRSYSNSCPLSQWCHPTISSSVITFSSCLQSFPASGSFQMSQFFTSGGHSTGVSASTSVLPMNIQDSFPLQWTGWLSLQAKGLSRVFSNTIVQKHQFFSTQFSWTSPDGQHWNQIDYILCSQRWRSYTQSVKTRSGADCGSDHELLIAKFRPKLKKVGKTTRPFRYDLNQIPYDYTVEVRNRFKGLDPIDRVPDELWTEVCDILQETKIKTIPKKNKCKKPKWLSEEALQIAVKRREVKSKGEKERYMHLNAEVQTIARREERLPQWSM